MTIAPVIAAIDVKLPQTRAFEVFTTRMGDWWTKGRTIGRQPHVAIILEPHPQGRWYERDAEGHERIWGKVLAWEPPARLLLGWQLDAGFRPDPTLLTEVEITFTAQPGGGTHVRLEHRNLERFGQDAARIAGAISEGWPTRLGDFATHCTTLSHGDQT